MYKVTGGNGAILLQVRADVINHFRPKSVFEFSWTLIKRCVSVGDVIRLKRFSEELG